MDLTSIFESMSEHHIFIYGVIAWDAYPDAEAWGIVTQKDIRDQMMSAPENTEKFVVHINSPGGEVYEGLAIYDMLKAAPQEIKTVAEGLAASMGSVIFMAGDEREMMENASIMWHNPWNFVVGESDDMRKAAEEMDRIKDLIIGIYSQSDLKENEIINFMDEETWFSLNEAEAAGIATGSLQETPQAFVKMQSEFVAIAMDKKESIKKFFTQNKSTMKNKKPSLLDRIKALTGTNEPSGFLVNLEDGGEINVNTDAQDIAEGDSVTMNDKTIEDGDYVLQDKRTITTVSGQITAIKQPEIVQDEGNIENAFKAVNEIAEHVAKLTKALGFTENGKGELVKGEQKESELSKAVKESLKQMNAKLEGLSSEDDEVKKFMEDMKKVTSQYNVVDVDVPANNPPKPEKKPGNEGIQAVIDLEKSKLRGEKQGE